jgi:hypothetical protein
VSMTVRKELLARLPSLWRNASQPSSNWYTVSVSSTQHSIGLFQGAILISFNACEDVGDLYQVMARKYPQRDDIVFAIRRLREALLKCSALVGFPRVFPRKHRSADAAAGYQWSVSSECSHSERRQGSTRSYSPPPV